MLVTHPNNKRFFESFQDASCPMPPICLPLETVVFDPYVPETKAEEIWEPPSDERFWSYGPEDEVWMRPLGMGTVRIEATPVVWQISEQFRWISSSFP